jgi:hypothetical protein
VADLIYRRGNLEHAAASLTNILFGCLLVALLTLVVLAAYPARNRHRDRRRAVRRAHARHRRDPGRQRLRRAQRCDR